MRFDKFTLKVQEAIQEAQRLAGQYGHQALDVEHLFAALRQPEGIVPPSSKSSAPIPGASKGRSKRPWRGCRRYGGATQTYMTPRLNKILERPSSEAARLTDEYRQRRACSDCHADEKDGATAKILRTPGSRRMRSSRSSWRSGEISGSPIPIPRRSTRL